MSSWAVPLLRLIRLSKRFGPVTAVRDVDLDIYDGDFVTILGPNGAGKTTLLRLIASLTRPTSGELLFFSDPQRPHRDRVGYMSHQSLLYNELTGYENLLFYARLYDLVTPANRSWDMLERIELEKARDQRVRGYSRGMKQRLALGRALLHEPQLVLLDEPYAGLDQHGSRLLSEILRSLKEENRTILLITHNFDEGLRLCNRIIIQHEGRVVYRASGDELDPGRLQTAYFQAVG